MDQWSSQGGYFANDGDGSATKSKPTSRQQFLCSVAIRQILESPEEGIKVGENTTTMVKLIGIVMDVETASTSIKFHMSDDTGVIQCIDYIEPDDDKKRESLMEDNYYEVIGSIKSPGSEPRRVMVFKVNPVDNFNVIIAHKAEILMLGRISKQDGMAMDTKPAVSTFESNSGFGNVTAPAEVKSKISPQHLEILNIIKNAPASQVGWSKNADANVNRKYSAHQLQSILDYLVGEGFIYTTIDDEHFAST